ncbi:hypothetical protein MNBD_GAMMA01-1474 [hydrothermal vent metagenome]|uniref:Uncharacterized protein n=1 Tax=hydrothermal vent metagenome TaxID=652676 RepID=A0A3B0VF15_9ZZZZ
MNNSIDNLYKKTTSESTPAALDNFILNQAKQSCKKATAKASKPKAKIKRWGYSLATAAVFVMGFSMIFNLQNVTQQMQVTPHTIDREKKFEVEFLPETTSALDPHRARTSKLKKQNAPAKYRLTQPEALTGFTQDTRESLQVPAIPKPIISASKLKAIPLAKQITDGDLELTHSPTSIQEQEQKEQSATADSTEAVSSLTSEPRQEADYDPQDNMEELGKVIATGSRIVASDSPTEITIPADIQKLKDLINQKHFAKAKRLLKKLKKKYPDYDFTEFENLIEKN